MYAMSQPIYRRPIEVMDAIQVSQNFKRPQNSHKVSAKQKPTTGTGNEYLDIQQKNVVR